MPQIYVHTNDQALTFVEVLECGSEDGLSVAHRLHAVSEAILRAPERDCEVDVLLQEAVSLLRSTLGFDRVMAYRFLPCGAGEVVAEAKAERAKTFLGLRFPASDIPQQARRLYLDKPLRNIPDARYTPVSGRAGTGGRGWRDGYEPLGTSKRFSCSL